MTQTDAFLLFRKVKNYDFFFFNGAFLNACLYILGFETLGYKSKAFSANPRVRNSFIPMKAMIV